MCTGNDFFKISKYSYKKNLRNEKRESDEKKTEQNETYEGAAEIIFVIFKIQNIYKHIYYFPLNANNSP